jgi:hypothetical protein
MKKLAILINLIIIVQFITLAFNVGELRCQDQTNITSTQLQAENIDKITQTINNETPDDKNIGVRIIEMVIIRNLNNRYQRLDSEELEEMLYKRR